MSGDSYSQCWSPRIGVPSVWSTSLPSLLLLSLLFVVPLTRNLVLTDYLPPPTIFSVTSSLQLTVENLLYQSLECFLIILNDVAIICVYLWDEVK